MIEDDRRRELVELWQRLASEWPEPAANRLHIEVIAPFQSDSLPPICWIDQAIALTIWQELANSHPAAPTADWAAFRDQCSQLRRRIEEEPRAPKSRAFGLLSVAKEPPALLSDLAVFLSRCHDAFGRLAAAAPVPLNDPTAIRQEIDRLLSACPA